MVTLPCTSDVTVSVDGQPRANSRPWANDDGAGIRNVVAPRFHFICDFRDVDARICAEISFICAVETGRSEVKSDRSVEKCVLDFFPDFLANQRHPVGALIQGARVENELRIMPPEEVLLLRLLKDWYPDSGCRSYNSGNTHNHHHCLDDVRPDQCANQNDRFGLFSARISHPDHPDSESLRYHNTIHPSYSGYDKEKLLPDDALGGSRRDVDHWSSSFRHCYSC